MQIKKLHEWKLNPKQGCILQEKLAGRVKCKPLAKSIALVAGADVAFSRDHERFFATVVVLTFPGLEIVEEVSAWVRPTFPYVPGLLSFREGPVLVQAFLKVKSIPDVVMFDGQGIAHPRRLGMAAHMGLWLGVPTVGCAKSRLVGKHEDPGRRKGQSAPLLDKNEKIGVVLRTRDGVKPVYVSPGHLADFETSTKLVLRCCTKYRLPEPTRLADIEVARYKREILKKM
jgi:deoxyribonuclease V